MDPLDSKASIYLNPMLMRQVKEEARRRNRSVSWVLAMAWRVARGRICTTNPGVLPPEITS